MTSGKLRARKSARGARHETKIKDSVEFFFRGSATCRPAKTGVDLVFFASREGCVTGVSLITLGIFFLEFIDEKKGVFCF